LNDSFGEHPTNASFHAVVSRPNDQTMAR
jgi:hypothetical protein